MPPADVPYWSDPGVGSEYRMLAEFQAATGREHGSHQQDTTMGTFGLALYTIRIPHSNMPHQPVPIVGNPIREAIRRTRAHSIGAESR